MKIINKTRGTILAEHGYIANSFFQRLKGVIGRHQLQAGYGLVIQPCSSIHTFFFTFNIDVIFLNSRGIVEKMFERLKPFRFAACFFRSGTVIELPEQVIRSSRTSRGDTILIGPYEGMTQ